MASATDTDTEPEAEILTDTDIGCSKPEGVSFHESNDIKQFFFAFAPSHTDPVTQAHLFTKNSAGSETNNVPLFRPKTYSRVCGTDPGQTATWCKNSAELEVMRADTERVSEFSGWVSLFPARAVASSYK